MADGMKVGEVRNGSAALWLASAISLLLGIAALAWCFGLNNHLSIAERKLSAAEQRNEQLAAEQEALNARMRATSETLGQSVGMTQKQVEARTQALMTAQASQMAAVRAQASQAARLEEQQALAAKQLGAVQNDVSSVKTDVGGAKASLAETQSDLDQTKAQLQRTIGDAGVMSGLIARNRDELETLKHKGDRNYYEFTLQKGAAPTLLSNIKLQARKVDEKHARYTLLVSADDRNIEKKDKSLDEPVQFFTGKDPVLYEIVVNNIAKNTISGYLSTPKSGAQPALAVAR